jgi:hypothetical protein
MTWSPVIACAISVFLILGISVAAQFGWLGEGRVKTVVVFLAGAGAMLVLRIAGVPPDWFSGSATGFALGVSFTAGAFVGTGAERSFRLPLLLGLGLTLLSANVVQAVRNVL